MTTANITKRLMEKAHRKITEKEQQDVSPVWMQGWIAGIGDVAEWIEEIVQEIEDDK